MENIYKYLLVLWKSPSTKRPAQFGKKSGGETRCTVHLLILYRQLGMKDKFRLCILKYDYEYEYEI